MSNKDVCLKNQEYDLNIFDRSLQLYVNIFVKSLVKCVLVAIGIKL